MGGVLEPGGGVVYVKGMLGIFALVAGFGIAGGLREGCISTSIGK